MKKKLTLSNFYFLNEIVLKSEMKLKGSSKYVHKKFVQPTSLDKCRQPKKLNELIKCLILHNTNMIIMCCENHTKYKLN